MNNTIIINKINALLHIIADEFAYWLNGILSKTADSWWEDCVLSSLSFSQLEIAQKNNFSKLSDFDLPVLLCIANKSWYDMQTITYLPTLNANAYKI